MLVVCRTNIDCIPPSMEATVTHSSALVADAKPDVITSLEESDSALAIIFEATVTPTETCSSDCISLLEISPFPKVQQSVGCTSQRKRRAEVSTVLTASPYKRYLLEMQESKQPCSGKDTDEKDQHQKQVKVSNGKRVKKKSATNKKEEVVQKKRVIRMPNR